ncbi:protein of unknown function (DUF4190) [Prauserella aidingensis]|uniref:DUF4190 domain-containing protein n=1 Tax=Prauserella aidingensis TaxID=387890 RepID=UPI0020A4B40A|nr:DUF4190 domain-containing protein [Prauserella aidingensis]MCP2255079.1 protein of unknown function (DUF4190) [Prauserella aidingensis]
MSDPNEPQYGGPMPPEPQPYPYAAPPSQPYGPYPPGQPYGPYPQGQPYGPYPPAWAPRPTNGMAVASMVLGILWLYWLGSILALIFGYIAKSQIKQRNEGGEGMATAGIVLGWVGVGILLAILGVAAVSIAVD